MIEVKNVGRLFTKIGICRAPVIQERLLGIISVLNLGNTEQIKAIA
jgi:hypothetical protein